MGLINEVAAENLIREQMQQELNDVGQQMVKELVEEFSKKAEKEFRGRLGQMIISLLEHDIDIMHREDHLTIHVKYDKGER